MLSIDILRSSEVSTSGRARQLEGMFDVPKRERIEHRWQGEVDLDLEGDWNVGLIVGPSGSGKSTIAREVFGPDVLDWAPEWKSKSVIDDFPSDVTMEQITSACSAVGFNTIPSWLKPYHVLSTGEKFRVDLARRFIQQPDPLVVDEFTSVIDRQVAKIGSFAAAKFARKNNRRFVAVTCHYDVIEWLDPDWVLEPDQMRFERRRLRRISRGTRPPVSIDISPVDYSAWATFAPYHYLTASLNKCARCYCAFVDGQAVAFCGVLQRPIKTGQCLYGVSRVVTLPDWQGLGLAYCLIDTLGAAYKRAGYYFHNYPAHPAFVRSSDKSANWQLRKRPGVYSQSTSKSAKLMSTNTKGGFGGRPCAVFRYVGPALDPEPARKLLETHHPKWFR